LAVATVPVAAAVGDRLLHRYPQMQGYKNRALSFLNLQERYNQPTAAEISDAPIMEKPEIGNQRNTLEDKISLNNPEFLDMRTVDANFINWITDNKISYKLGTETKEVSF